MSSRKLFPSNLNHVAGVADHLTVLYEFDCLCPPSLRRAPRRIEFQQDIPLAQLASKFQESWNELQFASLLKQGNVDQAFHQLSQVAERTLAAHATSDTVPRSASWQPGVRPSQPKAAHQAESVLLRRVRRLERRLRHLLLVPHVDTLRNKCVTGISQLAPSVFELAGYLTMSIEQLTNAAEAAVSRITQEEKLARIAAWGRQTHGNLARQSAWIKWRRQVLADIAKDPVQPDQHFAGIHPTSVIAEQQREWSARWTHDGVSTAPQVEQLLHSLPSPPLSAFPSDIQWTGSKLKQIAKDMVSKASGPDDWGAADLIVLPDGFWEALSRLWQKVYDTGSIPKMWAHARVALLPKQQMEWRPLSIASVFWRIGARHIVCQLRPWVETWLNHHVYGAAPGRSVSHALLRILDAANELENRIFVAQDLSKFFDSSGRTCMPSCGHLGASPEFCRLFAQFYAQGERIFSCAGILAPDWIKPTKGIMQGCPLSPLIACMLMHIWTLTVTMHQDVDAVCYIDDRTFWNLSARDPVQALRSARQRSAEFDDIFGFSCRHQKCHIASVNPEAAHLADQFNYPFPPHFVSFGCFFSCCNAEKYLPHESFGC